MATIVEDSKSIDRLFRIFIQTNKVNAKIGNRIYFEDTVQCRKKERVVRRRFQSKKPYQEVIGSLYEELSRL